MLTYALTKTGGVSLYEQLYRRVKDDILTGRLATGEKLPSKRALAAHLEVSVITVKNAYEQLMAEGYIYGMEKKGYYVSPVQRPLTAPAYRQEAAPPAEHVWEMDLVTNSIAAEDFPFTVWARLMRQTILEQGTGLLRPMPPQGAPELRRAIAAYLRQFRGMTVDEEQIRCSPRDFCAASFSVTDRKEEDFDVKAAPPGTIKDIMMASAYFPGFKQEKLGGKTYLDGGSVNNVPVDLLTDRGYKDIIVIRLYGIGVDRRRFMDIPEDVTVHEIAPRRNLGGILEFDSARTRKNMKLGYFDGLRFLYGLCGRKYYLDMPYSEAYYFGRIMSELDMFKEWLRPYVKEHEFAKLTGYRVYTEKIFPFLARKLRLQPEWDYRDLYGAVLEVFAKKMQMEVYEVYTPDDIVGKIHELFSDRLTIG